MKLKVTNKKQLKAFYRHLFFYKTFLFHFTKFELETDKYKISELIQVLNIKNRKERIAYIYDNACKQLDEQNVGKNICSFKNNQCTIQRKKNFGYHGCCRKCYHHTETGCPTKNLACKLFYCATVKEKYQVLKYEDIKVLKALSIRQKLIVEADYFNTREEVISDLYYGSLFLAAGRILYRLIRNEWRKRS